MGFPTPSALPDYLAKDIVFCNAAETLRAYVESTESKLLHAERKASEYKSKLEIAERHGWDSERRRQQAEKRYEESESKRREEIKEQSESKAALATIVAQLQSLTGGL
jgi:outer membrane receptor for Fe3+-dicitrate